MRRLAYTNGRTLYRSRDAIDTRAHFSGLAVASGRVCAVDSSSTVYAFGLKTAAPPPGPGQPQ